MMAEPLPDLLIFMPGEKLQKSRRDEITTLAEPATIAFNAGIPGKIDLKRGRYLALWDRDLIPEPGTLAAIIDFMDQTPEAGMATPAIINRGRLLPTFGEPPSFIKVVTRSRIDLSPPPLGDVPVPVTTISATAVIMRPEMLAETGFPAPGPGAIITLGRRGKKLGWHLYGLPGHQCRLEADPAAPDPVLGFIDLCRYLTARPKVDKRWFKR